MDTRCAVAALLVASGLAACAGGAVPPYPTAPEAPPAYDPASATATILVRATARGPLPRMRPIKFDAEPICGNQNREPVPDPTITANAESRLAGVIAWISRGGDRWSHPVPDAPAELELRRCMLAPHVLTLRVGQPLRVSNADHPFLHFHCVPAFNPEVNTTIREGQSQSFLFGEEEVGVKFKDDVHGWMSAFGGVFPHPFHGATDREGSLALNVPPGKYEVSAWHEYRKFRKPAPRPVVVAAGETKEIEFVFEVP